MSGLQDGIAQVGYHYSGYTPAELPVSTAIQELGFNYSDALVAAVANTDFNMNDKELLRVGKGWDYFWWRLFHSSI